MSSSKPEQWQWENATAGAFASFATVAAMHPLDVVRTRFQVNDGRISHLPSYKNSAHTIFSIARLEGLRGLYAGFLPAVLGSTISWGLYFFLFFMIKPSKGIPGAGRRSWAQFFILLQLLKQELWFACAQILFGLLRQDCSFRLLCIKHDLTLGFMMHLEP